MRCNGVPSEGLFEADSPAGEALTKGSSMECAALSYAMDLVYGELHDRVRTMPEHVQLNDGNTGREGKH